MKFFILIIAMTFSFSSYTADEVRSKILSNGELEELKMFLLINTHREEQGLDPLNFSIAATLESRQHSEFMAFENRGLTHDGFSERIDNIRVYTSDRIAWSAENIAYNKSTERAHDALLNSPGHRRNIEGDYTHMGVGIVTDERERVYFTQIYIRVKSSLSTDI